MFEAMITSYLKQVRTYWLELLFACINAALVVFCFLDGRDHANAGTWMIVFSLINTYLLGKATIIKLIKFIQKDAVWEFSGMHKGLTALTVFFMILGTLFSGNAIHIGNEGFSDTINHGLRIYKLEQQLGRIRLEQLRLKAKE